MKKYICELSGCNKTATRKTTHGRRICEDCAKKIRRHKYTYIFKEKAIGHAGEFTVYAEIPLKV